MKTSNAIKKLDISKFVFVFLALFLCADLHAARTITNITFLSDTNVTKNSTISLEATVILDRNGNGYHDYYRGLRYKIGNGAWICANSVGEMPDSYNVVAATPAMKTFTERFVIHADQSAGSYDITFQASYWRNCGDPTIANAHSADFTIPNAITISDGEPSFALNFQYGMFSSTNKVEFDCDHIYLAADNVFRINSINEGGPTTNKQGVDMTEIYRTLPDQRYERSVAGQKTPSFDRAGRGAIMRTMALGPYGENGTIAAIHWHWGDYWSGAGDAYGATGPAYIQNGTSSMTYINPRPPGGVGWSGGEVNQMSGEIYFSGIEDSTFAGAYQLMILDPVTGKSELSGRILPATPADSVDVNAKIIASDMAIDAEGNFYVLAYDGDYYFWLVRVVRGEKQGEWKYNKVKRVGQYRSPISQTIQGNYPGTIIDTWGMAFLNGKLYSIAYVPYGAALYEANPLTGEVVFKGNAALNPDGTERSRGGAELARMSGSYAKSGSGALLFDPKDLASCQVAPVLRGEVYYDANGDGLLSADEKKASGVANITIQLYDGSGKLIGEQETSGAGSYSFIVPINRPHTTTYYVRMKQPQINGANVPQTWADGGIYEYTGLLGGNNTATPTCYNGISPIHNPDTHGFYKGQDRHTYDTTCFGARSDGIDPSIDSISEANYYTRVDFMTDRAVAYANFAVSGVDRSDSPASYKDVSQAVMHKSIYLGKGVSVDNVSILDANANKDTLDDGILVKDANNASESFRTLQDYTYQNKHTYTFKVDTGSRGNSSEQQFGYLHGWMSLSSTTNATVTNYDQALKLTDENAKIGEEIVGSSSGIPVHNSSFEFNYTIPDSKINTTTNKSTAFVRFRYLPNNITDLSAATPAKNSTEANTQPWVTEGEVEDYKVTYFYVYNPKPVGSFIAVNQNFNRPKGYTISPLTSANKELALYTQVANQPFKVKLVYHDKGVIQPSFTQSLIGSLDFVEVPLKSVDTYVTESVCKDLPIIKKGVWGANTTETIITANITGLPTTKIGTFRMSYRYAASPNASSSYTHVCSPDVFAVRPATFGIDTQEKLIGGKKYENITVKALDINKNVATEYNQSAQNITLYENGTKEPTLVDFTNVNDNCSINPSIAAGEFKVTTTSAFTKGVSNKLTIFYNNIGVVNATIADKAWTDQDTRNDNDCVVDSGNNTHNAQGKVGCNIELNTKYVFIPKSFANNLTLSDFTPNFTYISNASSPQMAANAIAKITAVLDNNSVATNYHQNCYAKNITYSLSLENNSVTGWNSRIDTPQNRVDYFQAENGANITSKAGKSVNLFATEGNFSNGVAEPIVLFNFKRPAVAEDPFVLNGSDFKVSNVKDEDDISGVDATGNASTFAHFYYGRVASTNYRISGNTITPDSIFYEVFCKNSVICTPVTAYAPLINPDYQDQDDRQWYINTDHNSLDFGSVKEFRANPSGVTISPTSTTAINAGRDAGVTVTTDKPKRVGITMTPSSWLIHRNDFIIEFLGDGGGWAGKGYANETEGNTTGRLTTNGTNKNDGLIKRRLEW